MLWKASRKDAMEAIKNGEADYAVLPIVEFFGRNCLGKL